MSSEISQEQLDAAELLRCSWLVPQGRPCGADHLSHAYQRGRSVAKQRMSDKRFTWGAHDTAAVVIEGTIEDYNKGGADKKASMEIMRIKIGGAVSPKLAEVISQQICDILTENDVSLAVKFKLQT